MEQVFLHVFNTTVDCFEFGYDVLTSLNVFGSVSFFDMIIALYVCTLVPTLLATQVGSRGMSIGMGTTIKHFNGGTNQKYSKSYRALKGAKK